MRKQLTRNSTVCVQKNHSTETAVLRVLKGLLTKSDQKLVSVLALLDLNTAFDTLDNATYLLRRLESTFGISGVALSWFESYLSDRTQSVVADGPHQYPLSLVFLRDRSSDLYYSPCIHNPCLMS